MRLPLLRVCVAITLVAMACQQREPASSANRNPIIVISIDTLRSDHLPAYGYAKVATPAIDALRADGILFTHAYSHVPLTLPSHATILSGRLPAEVGLRDNAGFKWNSGVPSIAELLKANGYATGAAVSSYSLRSTTGIERGFDFYDDNFAASSPERVMGEVQRAGMDTERVAEDWIGGKKDVPFFFLLHLYEPHSPYTPPEPFKSRYPLAYDGEIAAADAAVGKFVAFLKSTGIYDRATIILLSDHGEGLGDHGEDEHGLLLYREALQVPLIVKPDQKQPAKMVDTPVQLVDVFATIAAVAGIDAKSSGVSLLAIGKSDRQIFAETYFPRLHFGWSDLHSVIENNNHLIRGTRSELFNLSADPAERRDLSTERRRESATLRTALEPMMQPLSVAEQITPEEAKKLAALGYVGSTVASSSGEVPDPRDQIATFKELQRAWGLYQAGRYADAINASNAVLKVNPKNVDMWQLQATAFDDLHRPAQAMEAAKRGLALNPKSEPLLIRAAYLSVQLRQFKEAEQYADLVRPTRPSIAHDVQARVALASGQTDRAESEARAALASGRESADIHYTLARVAAAKNDLPRALAEFDAVQRMLDRTGQTMRNLNHDRGFVLARMGRDAEAEKAFENEVRMFPDNAFAYKNLIVFYAVHGRAADEARAIDTLISKYPSGAAFAAVADAMHAVGNETVARKALHDGLSRYPNDPELQRLRQALH